MRCSSGGEEGNKTFCQAGRTCFRRDIPASRGMGEGGGKGEEIDVKVPLTVGKDVCHVTYLMNNMIVEVEFCENGVT